VWWRATTAASRPSHRAGRWSTLADETPPLDAWLAELGIEVVASAGDAALPAVGRDIMLDGERRFDLRATVAWVDGFGLSIWAYYGLDGMEVPRRVLQRMLRANFDYPFVKFALTDDDRPMLVSELPVGAVGREALGLALARIAIVADRLLEETASAVADRGLLPDWSDRIGRNPGLLSAYRAEVEATMPAWAPPTPSPRRRGLLARLLKLGQ
jgi:hypothetical protein